MTTEQIIILAIAVYGTAVATLLAIRELKAERRRIAVMIEYVTFYERAQLIIANAGHRPITISEIAMEIWLGQNGSRSLGYGPQRFVVRF